MLGSEQGHAGSRYEDDFEGDTHSESEDPPRYTAQPNTTAYWCLYSKGRCVYQVDVAHHDHRTPDW
eukprot:2533325-Rhodomonas_salina.3